MSSHGSIDIVLLQPVEQRRIRHRRRRAWLIGAQLCLLRGRRRGRRRRRRRRGRRSGRRGRGRRRRRTMHGSCGGGGGRLVQPCQFVHQLHVLVVDPTAATATTAATAATATTAATAVRLCRFVAVPFRCGFGFAEKVAHAFGDVAKIFVDGHRRLHK